MKKLYFKIASLVAISPLLVGGMNAITGSISNWVESPKSISIVPVAFIAPSLDFTEFFASNSPSLPEPRKNPENASNSVLEAKNGVDYVSALDVKRGI